MRKNIHWILWILAFALLLIPKASIPAAPQLLSSVSLVSPVSCPTGGCAAGQRLNFIASFDLLTYTNSLTPNIQICLFATDNWAISNAEFEGIGKLTGSNYSPDTTNCGLPPNNHVLVGGVSTTLSNGFFGDSIEFNFRLGNSASTNGSSLFRVFENNGTNWVQTEQTFTYLSVAPAIDEKFVANNAESCGTNSPCYINSKDDLLTGIGTGLKDAVDASGTNALIHILGDYQIKGNSVQINKPLTISGVQNSSITSTSTNCSNPMLSLENAITIQNLTINDGGCNATNRDLLVVDNEQDIEITSNNLVQGKDAIKVLNNQGKIIARFNNIKNNSGYALFKPLNSGIGQISMTANNIFNNRTGIQVDCNNLGEVNHNFWGLGILPGTVSPTCTSTPGKRLGSPIIDNINTAGVQAQRVIVTTDKIYYFENQIAVKRPGVLPGATDFEIYIVNHGINAANAPFLSTGSISTLVPCNNYYDIFLAEPYDTNPELELFMKYDANAACIANVESTTYCSQSNPALFPLWWYDPDQLITTGWNTTGQAPNGPSAGGATGQITTCNLPSKEISVLIDSSGRPGSNNDLTFTPFVVGMIGQPAATVLTSFTATPGNMQVTINWSTSSELNTSGFYVQRRINGDPLFVRISPLIVRTGSNTSGSSYLYTDISAINNTSYDYRLEIVGTNLLSVYSEILNVIPLPPTITPTFTFTPSKTLTPTRTLTPAFSQTPTVTITTTPTISLTPTITNTPTITMTPTRTRFRTATVSRTPFLIPYRSPTKSRTPFNNNTSSTGYPAPTNQNNQPAQGYPVSTNEPPSAEGGYPAPGESTQAIRNTPGINDQGQEATPIPQEGTPIPQEGTNPAPTRTAFGGIFIPSPGSIFDKESSTAWIYPLLGSLIGLSLVLLVGYFLWKKGFMALPLKPKSDGADTMNAEDLDDN